MFSFRSMSYRHSSFTLLCRTHATSTHSKLSPVRVRFAPSPTGQLHLGGLRTALYNYLLAKKTGGDFVLRIEDTDQARFVPGAVEKLVSSLTWAGIHPDEGPSSANGPYAPYYQSQRTDLYRHYGSILVEKNQAYRCFCTPERLHTVREIRKKQGQVVSYDKHCLHLSPEEIEGLMDKGTPYTVRHNVPAHGVTAFDDHVHGKLQFKHSVLDDTILIKSDGFPTYHLANVVDDHTMKITHVLRGEEWISSTPKHILLYQAFGWNPPEFAHLPLLLNEDRTKLSKRSGDVHVEQYIEKGYLPEAINNFVALLGWHPQSNDQVIHEIESNSHERQDEILDMQQLIQQFDLKHLHHAGAIVDPMKLSWINKQHLLRRTQTSQGLQSLVDMLIPRVCDKFGNRIKDKDEYRLSSSYLSQVIMTVKERIRNISDIPTLCSYYFVEPDYNTTEAKELEKKLKQDAINIVLDKSVTLNALLAIPFEEGPNNIKQWIHGLAETYKINGNHIMMVFRYIMTGTKVGAGVAETMCTLGQSTCIDRLNTFYEARAQK